MRLDARTRLRTRTRSRRLLTLVYRDHGSGLLRVRGRVPLRCERVRVLRVCDIFY